MGGDISASCGQLRRAVTEDINNKKSFNGVVLWSLELFPMWEE